MKMERRMELFSHTPGKILEFHRDGFFLVHEFLSVENVPDGEHPSCHSINTPPKMRGVEVRIGVLWLHLCGERWNTGWICARDEARGVWMEFVRKFHAQGICKEVTSPHAQLAQQSLEPWQPPTPANNNSIISDPTSPTLPPAWSMIYDESAYKEMQKY